MDFRIARPARDRYGFEEELFSSDGDALVIDIERALALARRFVSEDAEPARAASEIAAIGLLHELGHRAVAVERRADPRAGGPMARGLAGLDGRLGQGSVDAGLATFEAAFPALPVYRRELGASDWLARAKGGVPGREAALEELTLASIGADNPAAAAYRELIDDESLAQAAQRGLVHALAGADVPADEPDPDRVAPARSLVARLREPFVAAPQSLAAQLRWIRIHWAGWLDDVDLLEIDRHLGLLDEVERAAWLRARRAQGGAADAEAAALAGFGGLDEEPEAFSQDRDWMAELVMLAKSTYVWLAQLSRTYRREIARLDQIPDEELDELRARGFTGLWLIGLWQRSEASRRIKQMRGNPDALASAYSVADYRIADELGGDAAWADLRDRAAARGIRLAADMVPNHMGIDSRWVVEHPERFISSPHAPFEAYAFTGDDLSSDDRVVIQLEDHYWDSSDAAVVFKRIDKGSGEARYIYHGNDGTSFPWNDTAQLDYLEADVREAVIGQILDVARRFSVIRFDAAMVLARRHIQRLWYPLPGREAGIPSRSIAALPAEELRRRMPTEFWRDVVDRVSKEAPDTLLLAEAFWLMEGYFVRTLGMHRVYNSAFMHMLRDEKNAQYQQVIRETVAFDARILGRYVNFMSNPDERSATDQFGSHDKYFGVATLLATLPGLPMYGHGQVEGLSEQYGMEFRRPQRDEQADEALVARHRREIFPLLRQRWRFAGSSGFRQLAAVDDAGEVPDVFAFANRAASGPADARERRSLVVFLNRYPRADVRVLGVAEALGLGGAPGAFLVLRDERSGLDYLRHVRTVREQGLALSLDGYACHVFLGFDEVADSATDGSAGWAELAARIGLAGVPDARLELHRLRQEPLREAVMAIYATPVAQDAFLPDVAAADLELRASAGRLGLGAALDRLAVASGHDRETVSVANDLVARIVRIQSLRPRLLSQAVAGWAIFAAASDLAPKGDAASAEAAFDDWGAASAVSDVARRSGSGDAQAWRIVELSRALVATRPGQLVAAAEGGGLPGAWFGSPAVRSATGWNEWQGGTYLRQEAWDEFVDALAARDGVVAEAGAAEAGAAEAGADAAARELKRRAAAAAYRIGGDDGDAAPSSADA